MELSRRDLLKYGLLGSAAMLLPLERVARTQLLLSDRMPASGLPKPYELPWRVPPVAHGTTIGNTDVYNMHMEAVKANVLGPGRPATTIWGYAGTTPGPTIRVKRGRRVAVRHCQTLPATHPDQLYPSTTSVHLHGSASLPQYDGYASDVTAAGNFKDYHYPNFQDARTLWYHDHGIHHTANNAYMGLAAQYHIVDDRVDQALNLPTGEYDLPLVVKDAMFAKNGELIYSDNSESGLYGDVNLVNGVPWPTMKVKQRIYRFRILVASILRSYRPQLSTGDQMYVVATDAGLVPETVAVKNFRHSMAERYEVLIDFRKYPVGTKITMQNLSNPNNIDYDNTNKIMQFEVVGDPFDKSDPTWNTIPATPNPDSEPMTLTAADAVRTRRFAVDRSNGLWQFGGQTWEDVIDSGYQKVLANPGFNDVEIWEIENRSGGWFHPVHIHLVDFQILSRNGRPPFPYERGPKDVVYVGEGETVRLVMKFEHQQGRYMVHCHNLVHEDHDMMGQFLVGTDRPELDPIEASRPKPISEEF